MNAALRRGWIAAGVAAGWALVAQQDSTPTFRVETRLVEAYASVFDRNGNPLPNLTSERFQVFDGGNPQTLARFEGADDRISCAVLLDVTGSMDEFLPVLKNSVLRFVDMLREHDEVGIYTFNQTLRVKQEFTTDKRQVKQAVLRTLAGGVTALFDSLSRVSQDLEARKGKKALIVFTDGDDNASALSASGASRQARRAGVPVYAIAQGTALKDEKLLKMLESMAADTGGACFRLTNKNKIAEIFAEISRDLEHTYLLSWKPPENAGTDFRPIRISVAGMGDARIRVRQGYWPE